MRFVFTAALAAVVLSASGCAFQKQSIRLQPTVDVAASSAGAGKSVMVSVSDERPHSTLGTRGVGGIGEQLTLDSDLAATIKTAVVQGLQRQGFAAGDSTQNELRVEIRSLDYAVNSGFWAGKLNVEFALKGICMKGDARPYEQMYRGEFHKNIQVVQGQDSNNQFVNQVVSQAVNALLNDANMTRCLAD